MHVADALCAVNVCKLVGIVDDRCCPMGDHHLRKVTGNHHGALDMHVGIYKARDQVSSLAVKYLIRRIWSFKFFCLHMGNKAILNKYHDRVDLPGEHVDQTAVRYGQIRIDLPQCCLQQIFFISRFQSEHKSPPRIMRITPVKGRSSSYL